MYKRQDKREITEGMRNLLAQSGNANENIARAAQIELAKALTLPLREGVLKGDILANIYEEVDFAPGVSVEFPLDIVAPGTEKDYRAYTIPAHGRIPEQHVEGDYVMIPTFNVGNSIDWLLKYSRDARWDIVGRAMEVFEAGFVRKNNDDGWKLLITAAKNRGIMVYDDLAPAGLFTKRLVALMKTVMRRNAFGNSTSLNQGKLTDIYLSPEGLEDMRTWDLTQVDDATRRQIWLSNPPAPGEAALNQVFGVDLHDIDELGVGQEYQLFYTSTLSGSLAAGKVELVVGLDLEKNDSFVRPIRERVQMFEDPTLHRQQRAGYYGWMEGGFGVLDSRRILLGSL